VVTQQMSITVTGSGGNIPATPATFIVRIGETQTVSFAIP